MWRNLDIQYRSKVFMHGGCFEISVIAIMKLVQVQ
jgi:hypothetical protein